MRLIRLEFAGIGSFADRMEIDFEALVARARKQSSMFELELIDDCRADGGFSCMS